MKAEDRLMLAMILFVQMVTLSVVLFFLVLK
jgi:hypothetical protein